MVFSPLQSKYARDLCLEFDIPLDLSTAALIDDRGVFIKSAAVLEALKCVGPPWSWIGRMGLCVPRCLRDCGYEWFARNRGAIWKKVKYCFGLGNTSLAKCRHAILGVDDPDNISG
eukprot:TRINITY_DN102816_c0_g1_i1.p4 TRINITY_DN102816_c0_g1~~TRINITY_DN102816_c0_g1_i1.p4  ORF type:complete len:116 (+),score=8.77 TRINITY_DN102816_c0_g1_i1:271-618(+)